MIKIAFVTPFYLPARLSGSTIAVQQLAEGLNKSNFEVYVISGKYLNTRQWYLPFFGPKIQEKFSIINGVKVYRIGCFQIASLLALILIRYFKFLLSKRLYQKLLFLHSGPYFRGLVKIFRQEKFDIVYSSPLPLYFNWQVFQAIKKNSPKTKLIFRPDFHAEIREFSNPELQKVFDSADFIHIALGPEKNDIQKTFKVADEKFVVIPSFLNLQKLHPLEEFEKEVLDFRQRFGLENKKLVLFAASKIKEKGIIDTIEAIKLLRQKDLSYFLVIIGPDNAWWQKIKKEMPQDCFLDLGYVSEKDKEIIFAAADVFCQPSICESFGLTYLEAWHKKKPVIGADIFIVRELISGARGGLLVEFGNKNDLAKAIEKLFSEPELKRTLGENGYQSLIENYQSQKVIPKLEVFFREITEKPNYLVNPNFYTSDYYLSKDYAGSQEYKENLTKIPFHLEKIYQEIAPTSLNLKFLDEGCGKGEMLYFMAKKGYQVFGIDYSETAIAMTKELLIKLGIEGEVLKSDVRKMPFPENFFDIIIAADLIEHLNDNQAVVDFLNEAYRILKPEGKLFLHTAPNKLRLEFFVKYYQRYLNFFIFKILNLLGRKEYRPTLDLRSPTDRIVHVNEQTYFSLKSSFRKSPLKNYQIEIVGDPLEFNFWKLPYYLLGYFYPLDKIFPFSIFLGNHFYATAQK